jgi:GNAT superfamily N-acetyltransferase
MTARERTGATAAGPVPLRWLRGAVADRESLRSWTQVANDGIIATAGLLEGFAGAGAGDRTLMTIDEETARALWLVGPPARTAVAVAEDSTVVGTANMYANRAGPGSHVASASFMVDPGASGQGVGRALGEDALA